MHLNTANPMRFIRSSVSFKNLSITPTKSLDLVGACEKSQALIDYPKCFEHYVTQECKNRHRRA